MGVIVKTPSVAIVIAAYNSATTIERAVRSALEEAEVTEVFVVDDASTDGTPERALAADDGSRRLRVIAQERNRGPAAARNRALELCRSDFIGVLDADDYFVAGRIGQLLRFAPDADLIADDMWQQVAETGSRRSLLGASLPAPRQLHLAEFALSNVTDRRRQRAELGFLKPLMRCSFLASHQLRYRDDMRLGEDYELYARALAAKARFWLAPLRGYVSVVRSDSLSARHDEADLLRLRDCNLELARLPGLTRQERRALRRNYLSTDCRLQWHRLATAPKQQRLRRAFAGLARPYPVPLHLLSRLAEELLLRVSRKIARRRSHRRRGSA